MEFRHQQLPNGLEIIAEVNPNAFSASVGYFVNTGARDETPELSGVSHFLEHMLFKGTTRRTAEEVNRCLDDLGSQSNAYTSEEQTVYYMSLLPELIPQGVDLLTDMMRPALRDADFETERQVIIEEIAMYDDQPPYGAMERLSELYFGDHPLAGRVLGTKESVAALTADAMRGYHATRYAASNLCLVATGNVDFDRLVDQAFSLTKDWLPGEKVRRSQSLQLHPASEQRTHPPASQHYVLQFAPGVPRTDHQKYATRLMAAIMGDDSGSRLYWDLVDSGKAETAVVFTQEFQDCGIIGRYLACSPENVKKNWRRMEQVLRDGLKNPLLQNELDQAVNKVCSGLALAGEKPSNRLFSVGNAWTQRATYEPIASILGKYRETTLEEVQIALDTWLRQPAVSLAIGPEEIPGIFA